MNLKETQSGGGGVLNSPGRITSQGFPRARHSAATDYSRVDMLNLRNEPERKRARAHQGVRPKETELPFNKRR